MADDKNSKFSGLFDDRLKNPPPAAPQGRGEKAATVATTSVVVKAPARAQGKRSHPDYKQYSVLLKKQTHKQASRALEDMDNGQDLSDLMQQLLEQWVGRQNKKTQ